MSDLLIGGAGFIGAYLARELLAEGAQVVIYDREVQRAPIVELLSATELTQLELIPGDVTDPLHLFRTIGELRPARIVHLAAVLTPTGQADPAAAVRVITQGTTHVLEAVRQLGAGRLVWASSAQVFGPLDRYRRRHGLERILDDSTPDPVSIYGACKAHAEFLACHYARTWGLDITGLRPCGTLGPGRRGGATFEIIEMVRRVALGDPARAARADWVFPLMHVRDVVAGFLAALRREGRGSGGVYNLGGIHTSLRELGGMLQAMVPGASIQFEPSEAEPWATLEAGGIDRDLGYRISHTLEDCLAELVDEARRGAA